MAENDGRVMDSGVEAFRVGVQGVDVQTLGFRRLGGLGESVFKGLEWLVGEFRILVTKNAGPA